jgi:hypothetical protein
VHERSNWCGAAAHRSSNTLIDRTATFKGWAVEYVTTYGGDPADGRPRDA